MLQSCHVALLTKPIAETGCLERLAKLRGKECQMIRRRLGDDCGQIRMHRDCQLRAGLLLPDVQHTIAEMLAAHAHHVRAPLAGVKQQREREPMGCRFSNWAISASVQLWKPSDFTRI